MDQCWDEGIRRQEKGQDSNPANPNPVCISTATGEALRGLKEKFMTHSPVRVPWWQRVLGGH